MLTNYRNGTKKAKKEVTPKHHMTPQGNISYGNKVPFSLEESLKRLKLKIGEILLHT